MDRRQKKRILIFLLVPILAVIPFITDDTIIQIISIALLVIYIAFIIFLRDSLRFKKDFPDDYDDLSEDEKDIQDEDYEDSFEIISAKKKSDVITADNYTPELGSPKTILKPPDLKEKFEEIANETISPEVGHGGQFTFVLEKMLTVIKEAYDANTSIFFWYLQNKEKLTIEKYVSSSSEISERKYDIEDDILSKIIQKGEPELLSDISTAAESDVIRYYNSPQGIKSFVGVPLFYDKNLIAIIALDSKVDDAFGIETIYSLGRFVRLITMLITIFEEKHSDTVTQERLKGLLTFMNHERTFETENDLANAIEDSVPYFMNWDAFAFVYFHPVQQKFKTLKVINKTTSLKYIGHDLEIEINKTLVGKSIVTGMPVKIDDTSEGNYIRYSKIEDITFDGSFIAIPLVYNGQNYGVFCFENLKKNAYSNADAKFLKNALSIISYVIHSFSTQELLKSYISVDIETRALNEESFKERMESDLIKAKEVNANSALALVRIDDFIEQESLFEGNPFPIVLKTISETIAKEMTPINIFGRLGERTFGIYFFNVKTKDVFLWAEKLRVKIARKPISVVSKQSTYTISIGVASAANKTDVEEVIYNADLALQKAIERGGNKVLNVN